MVERIIKPLVFKAFIDISNYNYGEHIVTIEVLDSDNKVIMKEQRKINISAPKTLLNVDYPRNNNTYKDSIFCPRLGNERIN